jgi:hypothetical protein
MNCNPVYFFFAMDSPVHLEGQNQKRRTPKMPPMHKFPYYNMHYTILTYSVINTNYTALKRY